MTYPSDPNRPEFAFGARARQSPYFERARSAGACMYTLYNHMVMPVSYGQPSAEYDRLMNHASVWDVAAERQVQLKGPDAQKLAQMMSPRDVAKCKIGQGFYTPILNKAGGVVNDPILLKLEDDLLWLSIADSDVRLYAMGLADAYDLDVEVSEPDASPLAVQGPKAEDVIAHAFGEHTISAMVNLWQCYELICLEPLLDEPVAIGYPISLARVCIAVYATPRRIKAFGSLPKEVSTRQGMIVEPPASTRWP